MQTPIGGAAMRGASGARHWSLGPRTFAGSKPQRVLFGPSRVLGLQHPGAGHVAVKSLTFAQRVG
eukprot:2896322-Alexandrium_andersonii.AAC.1